MAPPPNPPKDTPTTDAVPTCNVSTNITERSGNVVADHPGTKLIDLRATRDNNRKNVTSPYKVVDELAQLPRVLSVLLPFPRCTGLFSNEPQRWEVTIAASAYTWEMTAKGRQKEERLTFLKAGQVSVEGCPPGHRNLMLPPLPPPPPPQILLLLVLQIRKMVIFIWSPMKETRLH